VPATDRTPCVNPATFHGLSDSESLIIRVVGASKPMSSRPIRLYIPLIDYHWMDVYACQSQSQDLAKGLAAKKRVAKMCK